ncbi:MAG: YgiT-type zinc finger protein [Nitrospirota bacterium]
MKCMMCNGEMEKKNVPYSVDRKGYHLYIREVQAYVCTQCGEKYFDEHEVDDIQTIIKTVEQKIEKLKAA